MKKLSSRALNFHDGNLDFGSVRLRSFQHCNENVKKSFRVGGQIKNLKNNSKKFRRERMKLTLLNGYA